MAHVRDRPSLRESVEITTPSGKKYRWADDEYRATDTPAGERWSDTMPGGYETHDVTLPRKPAVDYSDLERLSTLTRCDASGGIIWQGRLERAPRVSGDQVAISPSAVGWQAHLEDDKSATMIYLDRDLSRWRGMSSTRRIAAIQGGAYGPSDGEVSSDATDGTPRLAMEFDAEWASTAVPIIESWYDAGAGNLIGEIRANWQRATGLTSANWSWLAYLANADNGAATSTINSGDLQTEPTATGSMTLTADNEYRYALLTLLFGTAAANNQPGVRLGVWWDSIRVIGDHGLTLQGSTASEHGFYDADIIDHALGRWCPLISTTSESLTASTFVIPQMAFLDPTTVGEIVRQSTRFGLRDWAVWDDKTFWLHDRGAHGRSWRARVGPAQLEETGPQVDRLWNSIIVAYQDVDGTTRTVGPVGSGTDTETDDLTDPDPENPANKVGIIRRDLLTMGTGTAASATEIGRRFLEESTALDSSGRAVFVGHVEDDRGVMHPYSHVHAGDTVTFVDAADASTRRIVKTDKNRQDRSCSIDIDAPPEGLQALLERLGVVLVPLGL